jgi:hypothetical protein
MADSGALRARRARAHKAGDHHLCKGSCAKAQAVAVIPVDFTPVQGGNVDVRASLAALARRLEAAHEAEPDNAAVARELRATLLTLGAGPGRRMDAVDQIRADWEALNGPGV